MVEEDLIRDGIELIPSYLPEILAKIHTGECRGGKGVFLLGNTGTGKSLRLQWAAKAFDIPIWTASDLVMEMQNIKHPNDMRELLLCNWPHYSEVPRHYNDMIIDDLGLEPDGQNIYGTQRYLMEDAIIKRYEVFADPGKRWVTHFTCNLTKEAIRARYGERVWSRLNEMVTFVSLVGKDRRMK